MPWRSIRRGTRLGSGHRTRARSRRESAATRPQASPDRRVTEWRRSETLRSRLAWWRKLDAILVRLHFFVQKVYQLLQQVEILRPGNGVHLVDQPPFSLDQLDEVFDA